MKLCCGSGTKSRVSSLLELWSEGNDERESAPQLISENTTETELL